MAIGWCQVCGSSVWSGQPCGKCAHDGIVAARDAEIVRLKAEVTNQRHEIGMLLSDLAAHKRALAAGPAALRVFGFDGYAEAARDVEAAQAAAMKDDGKKGGE